MTPSTAETHLSRPEIVLNGDALNSSFDALEAAFSFGSFDPREDGFAEEFTQLLRMLLLSDAGQSLISVRGVRSDLDSQVASWLWTELMVDGLSLTKTLIVGATISWFDGDTDKDERSMVVAEQQFRMPMSGEVFGPSSDPRTQLATFVTTAVSKLSARLVADSAAWRASGLTSDPSAVNTTPMFLVYVAEDGTAHEQPFRDVPVSGSLIDPDTGDDMPIIGWRDAASGTD